jgi:hypothetical protein
MDTRLEQALEYSNFRSILANRQENLKVLLQNRLLLTYAGGLFSINNSLISLVLSLILSDRQEFIFIDNNDVPILIDDLNNFLETILTKYEDALSSYYKNYQKLNEARKIGKVINWNEED